MPAITTFFCEWTDVEARLGATGAAFRVDDTPENVTALKNSVLRRATVEVLKYVGLMYAPAALAASPTVREICADIAWAFADTRRNNPLAKAAKAAYEAAIQYLKDVKAGAFQLPDVAARKGAAPTLSNQRAAQYPVNRVVTVQGTSTGKPEGYIQHVDNSDGLDYSV